MMITTVLLGVGLSMDCIATLLTLHTIDHRRRSLIHFVLPVMFAFAHTLMPFVGWILGIGLKGIVTSYDHWIAFFLLVVMGIKMIKSSLSNRDSEIGIEQIVNLKSLLFLVFATSMDATVIGMTFALLNQPIISSALTIGITTLVLSLAADIIGDYIGPLFKNSKQEILGGLVLIGIGLKILIEHLFF